MTRLMRLAVLSCCVLTVGLAAQTIVDLRTKLTVDAINKAMGK